MNRNIELKARYADMARGHAVAASLGATSHAVERQCDTYFRALSGRLKLRERWLERVGELSGSQYALAGEAQTSQLIWYERADMSRARHSDYQLVAFPPDPALRQLLERSLGVIAQVVKRRAIYLIDGVRVHLDDVLG